MTGLILLPRIGRGRWIHLYFGRFRSDTGQSRRTRRAATWLSVAMSGDGAGIVAADGDNTSRRVYLYFIDSGVDWTERTNAGSGIEERLVIVRWKQIHRRLVLDRGTLIYVIRPIMARHGLL